MIIILFIWLLFNLCYLALITAIYFIAVSCKGKKKIYFNAVFENKAFSRFSLSYNMYFILNLSLFQLFQLLKMSFSYQ